MALAACSNIPGKTAAPSATLATEPPRPTTTDPYAVPSVIDAAYVNRVLAGLDAVFGDVVRTMVNTKALSPDAVNRLQTIYANRTLLNLQLEVLQGNLRFDLAKFPPVPGDKRTTVSELMVSSPACIYARVNREYSVARQSVDTGLKPQG